jgi:ribosome assembly protein 1
MPKLVEGLRLLNQADSCVETLIQETGEHVILTAGELHLERCLRDLRERFAKIEIQASPPIVPFRETAVHGAEMAPTKTKDAPRGTIHGQVQGGVVQYTIRARPLPAEVTAFLIAHVGTLKRLAQRERELALGEAAGSATDEVGDDTITEQSGDGTTQIVTLKPAEFWKQLDGLFVKAGKDWQSVSNRIWAFGPRRIGPNILVDSLPGSTRSLQSRSQVQKHSSANGTPARAASPDPDAHNDTIELPTKLESDVSAGATINVKAFDESIDTAFQLTTLRGPLCNEPTQGMAYFVEKLEVNESVEGAEACQSFSSLVKSENAS